MVDNLESLDDLESEDGNRGFAAAAIVGSAVVAGVLAFLIRRARQEPPPPEPILAGGRAWERAREMAFGDERAQATRDFLIAKVLPELKPALLGVLEEVEDLVDDGFRRAEKAIKSM
jgi:hypothetical protein